jgi:DNA-binding NtrC family response regulator
MLIQFDSTALNAGHRRALRDVLAAVEGLELQTFTARGSGSGLVSRILASGRGVPVLVADDRYTMPRQAPWLLELESKLAGEPKANRPWLVYISSRLRRKGQLQAEVHPLIAAHVHKDGDGRWIDTLIDECTFLLKQRELLSSARSDASSHTFSTDAAGLIGTSPAFVRAKKGLMTLISRNPALFLFTGPFGAGKLHMLRCLWGRQNPNAPLLCVSAGAFYKDAYNGRRHYRLSGGSDGLRQLDIYLESADDGLLVLQDIEKLPVALQDELVDRLDSRYVLDGKDDDRFTSARMQTSYGDEGGMNVYTTRVVCISCLSPEELTGRKLLSQKLQDRIRNNIASMPSLEQRDVEDIALLAEQFAHSARNSMGKTSNTDDMDSAFTIAAAKKLSQACYPHNVADLKAVVERAVRESSTSDNTIRASDLILPTGSPENDSLKLDDVVAKARRMAISKALERTGGNLSKAAELLGKDRTTIHRLMKSLNITV